jgi:hypothetical protein
MQHRLNVLANVCFVYKQISGKCNEHRDKTKQLNEKK